MHLTEVVGREWIVDASGCDAASLRDTGVLQRLFADAVHELGLSVVSATWHQFPEPGGVTGIALLTESHLTCHTYPEFGSATFNLYCCKERPRWDWEKKLGDALGATNVRVTTVPRSLTLAPHRSLQPA
jgi:S-adenosylmethionine decarboxylase